MVWYLNSNSKTPYTGQKRLYSNDVEIPEKPSSRSVWNIGLNTWEEKTQPNWKGLYLALRDSSVFQRAYIASKGNANAPLAQTNKAQAVRLTFSMIHTHLQFMSVNLTTNETEQQAALTDFVFFISELRTALASLTPSSDFTNAEIEFLNQTFELNYFPINLS